MKQLFTSINWRYSIGEIIIVSIGIMLAFSLGAWNENHKVQTKKSQYILSLIADLEEERDHLRTNNTLYQEKIKNIRNIQPILYGQMEGRDTAITIFFRLAELVNYNPPRVTYDVMVNTGDIQLISELDLQKTLVQHYSNHGIVRNSYERISQINQNYFADLLIYDTDYQAIRQGDFSVLDKPMVRNLAGSLLSSYQIAITSNSEAIEECDNLLKALKNHKI
jgi:hypothetical protein